MTIAWQIAGATDVGRVREINEDAFRIDQTAGIVVVADGMGGHAAGEVASNLAADHVLRALAGAAAEGEDLDAAIAAAFHGARREIIDCCANDGRTRGMGTTLTLAILRPEGAVLVGHLGDSRLYRYTEGGLRQITVDHTWIQREFDAGRLSRTAINGHRMAHLLTRALTAEDPADPDVVTSDLLAGDTLLLCSDGLHNLVNDKTIAEIVAGDRPGIIAANELLAEAIRRGGTDNITAVVVRVE